MNSKTDASNSSNKGLSQPRKWWQWFFVYPMLATTLIASLPTYVEAFKSIEYGVKFGESNSAKEQDDLWEKNLSCAMAPLDPLVTEHNIKVDATVCKSGDVLVRIFSPDGKQFYKWVAVNNVIKEHASIGAEKKGMGWSINQAHASSNQEPILLALIGTVICQKYLGPGRVLRRISVSGQGCFDEIINTYTGVVVSTTPASCDPQC